MFTSERRNKIHEWVQDKKHVDVSELSSFFNVSEVTIRKDLIQLESAGKLIRTYGGAISMEQASSAFNHQNGNAMLHGSAIPKLLVCMIDEGDLIYLGGGPVCLDTARILAEKSNVSVITNNISAASVLAANPNISVLVTPGEVSRKLGVDMLLGNETVAYLSSRSVDKAVIAVDSVKMTGFGVNDFSSCKIYQQILPNASEVIIAAESAAFNRNAIAHLGALNLASRVIGDESMPEGYISCFYDSGIKVFNSYDIENANH